MFSYSFSICQLSRIIATDMDITPKPRLRNNQAENIKPEIISNSYVSVFVVKWCPFECSVSFTSVYEFLNDNFKLWFQLLRFDAEYINFNHLKVWK